MDEKDHSLESGQADKPSPRETVDSVRRACNTLNRENVYCALSCLELIHLFRPFNIVFICFRGFSMSIGSYAPCSQGLALSQATVNKLESVVRISRHPPFQGGYLVNRVLAAEGMSFRDRVIRLGAENRTANFDDQGRFTAQGVNNLSVIFTVIEFVQGKYGRSIGEPAIEALLLGSRPAGSDITIADVGRAVTAAERGVSLETAAARARPQEEEPAAGSSNRCCTIA